MNNFKKWLKDDKYIIFDNEEISETNLDNLDYYNGHLNITQDCSLKIIYNLSAPVVNIDFKFNKGLKIKLYEFFLNDNKTSEINLNYNVLENVELFWNLYFDNTNCINLKRNAKTNIGKASYIKIDSLSMCSSSLDLNYDFYLDHKNSELYIRNSILNNSGQTQNYNFNVYHNVGENVSDIFNAAVSKNNSVLNINNIGVIKEKAAKTNLHQKTKGVILDEGSQISANPILEIDEYDVIAGHGASIGAIDDEDLFYMMSRGLSKSDSEKLIVGGLIYPYIASIDNNSIKEYVEKRINLYL